MILKSHQTKSIFRLLIFLVISALQAFRCYSQDLYDPDHSRKYAEYLFSSQQHELAAQEYERLIFYDNSNTGFKLNLIKSYRLSGNLSTGIRRIYSFYGHSPDTMPRLFSEEYLKMQLLSDSLQVVRTFLNGNTTLSPANIAIFQSCNMLLNGEYKQATLFVKKSFEINPAFPEELIKISARSANMKLKSPLLAAGFSAIVPGSGKFYTRNWSDGIVSLLFVAGNAFQAYRGFNEHGIKSGYGWAFASLSASFYIGNIFGSAKAARRYNTNRKNEIDNQVFEIVRSDRF
jgi:tetratricopeptide (TPR) repeat protein